MDSSAADEAIVKQEPVDVEVFSVEEDSSIDLVCSIHSV